MTWGYWCNRLEKLQKRLIRIKSRSKYSTQTEPRLNQLELLNLSDLLELSASKLYFKYLHGSHGSINLADNGIHIFLPTLVNSTELQLVHKITTHSIQGFSSHIKRYLINRYRDNKSFSVMAELTSFSPPTQEGELPHGTRPTSDRLCVNAGHGAFGKLHVKFFC